jgi:hypothetical protein
MEQLVNSPQAPQLQKATRSSTIRFFNVNV